MSSAGIHLHTSGRLEVPEDTRRWLLESPVPWVRLQAGELFASGSPGVISGETDSERPIGKEDTTGLVQGELIRNAFIQENIRLLQGWGDEVLKGHNKGDLLIHRFAMLADLGIRADDPGVGRVIEAILHNTTPGGIPLISILIPKAFRGSGEVEQAWILCDYPVILYGLLRMGVDTDETEEAAGHLEGLVTQNGYPCSASLPGFRGPGKKTDPCPMANLFAAKALSVRERTRSSPAVKAAGEMLLRHWEERGAKKYFLFGIGTDFRKLKFPLVWYNLLHVLEVLSRIPSLRDDPRLKEMAVELASKADSCLRFTPESIFLAYKGEDFADKKHHSPTITLFALRILYRLGIVAIGNG